MQSGISASQELFSQFKELQSSDSYFGLLVTITNEKLEPIRLLERTSPDFTANLSTLEPHLSDNEALYVILKRYDSNPVFFAVTFVPDLAKVRQKTLFASTRLTLVRELGSEHFRDTLLANAKEELSAAGFAKQDAHAAIEAPLTEEEQSLQAVKRAEQEISRGTGRQEIHLGKSLDMPFNDEALEALNQLGSGSLDMVSLKINSATETVELDSAPASSPSSIDEVVKSISTTEPRFTFYRFHHTHDGTQQRPLLFFYTCPATPGTRAIKARMLYPLMKRTVLEAAASGANITVDKKFEVDEPTEITEATVLSDLHPKAAARTGFSRPKRPGR
ncbi:Twinfilin-1 [Ceratocystis pirilliformis]|uniref:Twinfilin-1 n=1 Tax=Ceratocystis pirilliformis TaxID=259994 RepID=A0ABR3ZKY4_9PEZI